MRFIADLHLHSKYSRATAKNLDLESIHVSAQIKGIQVVATGDFTHPAWFSEIKEKLTPCNNGFFQLNATLSKNTDKRVPPSCRRETNFILSSEISNIYKKKGKVRKNHNLVFFPDLKSAQSFNRRLEKIGNIRSDGRPILGLDARDLLEIVLETSESAFLIPAHIWTPWFSLFGSKSGFDSLKQCFEDLASHIFALETGLSSDPEMNWRVSQLDGLSLVSNSDAHSPGKIGREANLFETEFSFSGIRSALADPKKGGFKGTVEFFPEEGKYHLDGHRKCGIRLEPEETQKHEGLCPACQKPVTLGVLHRVFELADRKKPKKPEGAPSFRRTLPLEDILCEVLSVGPSSKKIKAEQQRLVETLGPELSILHEIPLETLDKMNLPLFKEAVQRARNQEIRILPGFDGQFGTLKIFDEKERRDLLGCRSLFSGWDVSLPSALSGEKDLKQRREKTPAGFRKQSPPKTHEEPLVGETLNAGQHQAVYGPVGPFLVSAGPGTGKTHTLTRRIAHRLQEEGPGAGSFLAVTFTQKAAEEMKERLSRLLKGKRLFHVATFHAFCLGVLKEVAEGKGERFRESVIDEQDRRLLVADAIRLTPEIGKGKRVRLDTVVDRIVSAKQRLKDSRAADPKAEGGSLKPLLATYEGLLRVQRLMDYEDLIARVVSLFQSDAKALGYFQHKYRHLYIDEYQDINEAQYSLVRLLYPKTDPSRDLFAIGDPNQAIYGFRGSDVRFFKCFPKDYPEATLVRLSQNYRLNATVLEASRQILQKPGFRNGVSQNGKALQIKKIDIFEYPDEKKEAAGIAEGIETLVGGTGYFYVGSGKKVEAQIAQRALGFSDFAVLVRLKRQTRQIAEAMERAGIPHQIASKKNLLTPKTAGLCSLLRLGLNQGTFADLDRALAFLGLQVGKKSLSGFKALCLENGLSLQEGFRRFSGGTEPTVGRLISNLDEAMAGIQELSPLPVAERLRALDRRYGPRGASAGIPEAETAFDALDALVRLAGACGTDAEGFLEAVSLKKDADSWDEKAQKVSLMTLHAAKGLEFPVVFVAGCEDEFLPHARAKAKGGDLDEERRLFYVGVTRAKELLFFTWAKQRTLFGKVLPRRISPFVLDIEKNLVQYREAKERTRAGKGATQLTLFQGKGF